MNTTTPATTTTALTAAPPATTTVVPTASTLPPTTAQVVQGIEELDHFAPFEPGARYSLDPDADPSTAMRVVYEIPAEDGQDGTAQRSSLMTGTSR